MGRVLRRLSRPVKVRGFLVGLSRCDAKVIVLSLCHTLLQLRLQAAFLTNFTGGCNPPAQVGKIPVAQRHFPAMKT